MKPNIKKVTLKNIDKLRITCIDAYSKNFANHWIDNGLELYLESQFNYEKLKLELSSNAIEYYFINNENDIAGFLKLKTSKNDSIEIEKIYLHPQYKRMGLGKFAFSSIIKTQKEKGTTSILLDVIDTNTSSILFYKKLGFKTIGTTTLNEPYFKENLKGMFIMELNL